MRRRSAVALALPALLVFADDPPAIEHQPIPCTIPAKPISICAAIADDAMVAKAKELGIDVKYIEVPGGSHGGVVAPNLAGMFEFFNAHRKGARSTSQP
jgi:hypothetical protein